MKNENGELTGITFVVMPIDILQDKNLTSSEKILYCYLSLFKKGVCFQSNEKLAEMTGLDESTIKRGLKKLAEMAYIFIEYVNNNSAARRIYTILDNPKKLAYLTRAGMFDVNKKVEQPAEAEEEEKKPEPILDISSMKIKPKRSNYSSDEEYEEAFYNWNKAVI